MIRVGINGFGRIGRFVVSLLARTQHASVVAINDPMPLESACYLLTHDSAGVLPATEVSISEGDLKIAGKTAYLYRGLQPNEVPWGRHDVDVVIEASGLYRTRSELSRFLEGGAKRILTTYPIYSEGDITLLPRINEQQLKKDHKIISAGTCTAQGLAPVVSIIHDTFEILRGSMSTVHAYTANQPTIDTWHPKNLRKGRAAAHNIVPVDTIAIKTLEEVIPSIRGRLKGYSLRVPVVLGSFLDLTLHVGRATTAQEVNDCLRNGACTQFPDILSVRDDEPVSSDILGCTYSAMIDSKLTEVIEDTLVRVCFWYDNETGFSNRLAEMISGVVSSTM